jgi:hypothetical protein
MSHFDNTDRNQADMVRNPNKAKAILNLLEITLNIHQTNLKMDKKLHINMK